MAKSKYQSIRFTRKELKLLAYVLRSGMTPCEQMDSYEKICRRAERAAKRAKGEE
jgi:hypothetical protein